METQTRNVSMTTANFLSRLIQEVDKRNEKIG